MKKTDILPLGIALGTTQLTGILGSLFTASAVNTWYTTLTKPPLTPPGALFGPVWTTLFVLMGIAVFLVWKKRKEHKNSNTALVLFSAQLVLNFLWSLLFFGAKSPALASGEIVLLWGMILATIISFAKISKTAAWLMIPYLLWVSFATYLTFAFWIINT